MKWEQNEAIALSCQSISFSPGCLGPLQIYLQYCEVFIVPLFSEMNFAQGGGSVIMMQSVCMCV